ncbi:uncharacterized protein LOC143476083 isoform X2 [Brachyhypopomus gauderio]|uniref:uncharacterized protein LOC143476083 isoform X2 n=1 Tax=Brachyhypopomus gauderio TaxID=698409 RepID=UPI0040416497
MSPEMVSHIGARSDGGEKTSGSKTQLSPSKPKHEYNSPGARSTEVPLQDDFRMSGDTLPTALNVMSHDPRLWLARAPSRCIDTHEQACDLYQEVISMTPEIPIKAHQPTDF